MRVIKVKLQGSNERVSKQATEVSSHDPLNRERQGSNVVVASNNLADFFLAPSCRSEVAKRVRSRTLGLADAEAETVVKACRRRYPTGIWVNHVMVLDERH